MRRERRYGWFPAPRAAALAAVANAHRNTDLILISCIVTNDDLQDAWFYVPRMLHHKSVILREHQSADGPSFEWLTHSQIAEWAGPVRQPPCCLGEKLSGWASAIADRWHRIDARTACRQPLILRFWAEFAPARNSSAEYDSRKPLNAGFLRRPPEPNRFNPCPYFRQGGMLCRIENFRAVLMPHHRRVPGRRR